MRALHIEWRHYDKEGATCDRCASTGKSVIEVVSALRSEFSSKGIVVTFSETKLPAELMAQSNQLLFNGIPLEEVLANASAGESHCQSCSCLAGTETSCRTVEYAGTSYEEIPAELIREAAYKVIDANRS